MFTSGYHHLRQPPLTSTSKGNDGSDSTEFLQSERSRGMGKPRAKSFIDRIDILAIAVSNASLVVSVYVILPDRHLSWRLGYEGQIIVIGFLLSVMTLCSRRIAPTFFILLEARWGNSRLQNYESLLRTSVTLPHTGIIWRTVLLVLLLLPLGLSAAYKKFSGGQSTISIRSPFSGHYGLAPPPLGSDTIQNNTMYYMINATTPFWTASLANNVTDVSLPLPRLPKPYGFNTLLIDNSSTALLDVPEPEYVSSIQQNLTLHQSWTLSATVHATVARCDLTGDNQKNNDTFWALAFNGSDHGNADGQPGLKSVKLWDNYDLGVIFSTEVEDSVPNRRQYCLFGFYNGSVGSLSAYKETDTEADIFRNASLTRVDIQREICSGTWNITKTDFQLISGSCTNTLTPARNLEKSFPYYVDVLPLLANLGVSFAPDRPLATSPWRVPWIVTSMASAYWSRATVWIRTNMTDYESQADIHYPAKDEKIFSTNPTLEANWLLFLILCLQPFLTIFMFICSMSFYDTPIDKGFGLQAILAGSDRTSLDTLEGASLSGELKKPVSLNMTVIEESNDGRASGRICYSIDHERQGRARIRRGLKYG